MSKLLVLVSVSPGRRASTNDPLVAAAMTRTLRETKGGLDEIKRRLAANRVRRRQGQRSQRYHVHHSPILISSDHLDPPSVLLTGMDDSY